MEHSINNEGGSNSNSKSHSNQKGGGDNKDGIRKIISYILSFLLTVCLTLMTLLIIIKFGALNEKSLYNNMSSYGYYDHVYSDFMEKVKSVTMPTGFPESIYDEIVSKTDIYNDVNGSLKEQFGGEKYETNAKNIRQKLSNNIDSYFVETSYTATDEEKAAIEAYIDTVADNYDKYIKLPLGSYIIKAKNLFEKVFFVAFAVLIVMVIIIIFLLVRIHKWKHKALRYMSFASLATMLMVSAYPLYLYAGKVYYRLGLSPESFYKFTITYIDNLLLLFIYFGLFWLAVGILLAGLVVYLKKLKKTRRAGR